MGFHETATFLSWAGKDRRLKASLLDRLEPHLKTLPGVKFTWWEMSHIQIGEAWRHDILARIDESDAILQLLSPSFFASDFIVQEEIPACIGPEAPKRALPVGLKPFPLDPKRRLLQGVNEHQIFRLGDKFYSECSATEKDRFALELANAIQDSLTGKSPWRKL